MNMKLKLLQIGFFLAIQAPAILLAQSNELDSTPEISISIEDGKVKIAVNLNEPFRWENTKFNSIKTFPMRGGSKMPHTIRLDESNNVNWTQTDVVFSGTYGKQQSSAKDVLDQYTQKNGDIGIRTWSVDKNNNLKSFNELTGSYEIFTPKEFAAKYELDFYSNKYSIEASISGYLVEIIGVFNPETNLLNFDTLDYVPFFQVPKLAVEESKDMEKWSEVKLPEPLTKEYQWPQELKIELEAKLRESTFYRVKKETIEPNYSVEGRWLWSPTINIAGANTMYEFLDGTRYTYYCGPNCDWDSLEISDAIPGTDVYTYENDTLTIDGVAQAVTFECDGGKINFGNWNLWKLGSDCE